MRNFAPTDHGQLQLTPPCLTVSQHGKPPLICALHEGGSVFAGSAASCGIQISGEDVAQYHCMFSFNQGRLWVQDCQTGGEFLVNGKAIDCETVLNHGDEVKVGAHQIVAVLANFGLATPPLSGPEENSANGDSPGNRDQAATASPEAVTAALNHDPSLDNETREYLDQLIHELSEETTPESESAPAANPTTVHSRPAAPVDVAYQTHDFRDEECELLREEIAHLQRELAERDAELARWSEGPADEAEANPLGEDENVVRLVQRLEELLDELQKSDGRVLELEELLRSAEDAKRAEQDEREQLANWVDEIEQRLAQREAETEAEVERLRVRNEALQLQLQKSDSHVQSMVKTVAAPAVLPAKAQEIMQGLRDRCEELARRVQESESECERLRGELKSQAAAAAESLQALEQKLVEHELNASRERAEIARSRAELERARDDLDRGLHDSDLNETDTKFAAMRQHLRELHEQEARAREERKQRSLSGRIASLLTRVGQR